MGNLNSIKYWNKDEQPREKLIQHGAHVLSNAELLSVLIATGTKEKSAIELCQELVTSSNNSLHELGKKNITELTKIKGIGIAKALSLTAAFELGRRRKLEVYSPTKISSSLDIYKHIHSYFDHLKIEEFWIFMLNRSNCIVDKKKISSGGTASTIVDIKIVLRYSIDSLAESVIIAHNHPSGNTIPSKEDEKVTLKIKNALQLMDIKLLDHLIIGNNEYYSFADCGLL